MWMNEWRFICEYSECLECVEWVCMKSKALVLLSVWSPFWSETKYQTRLLNTSEFYFHGARWECIGNLNAGLLGGRRGEMWCCIYKTVAVVNAALESYRDIFLNPSSGSSELSAGVFDVFCWVTHLLSAAVGSSPTTLRGGGTDQRGRLHSRVRTLNHKDCQAQGRWHVNVTRVSPSNTSWFVWNLSAVSCLRHGSNNYLNPTTN